MLVSAINLDDVSSLSVFSKFDFMFQLNVLTI